MKISILVSMYNKKNDILDIIDKMFLPSLIRNGSKDKEVILVDDFSPLKIETEKVIGRHIQSLRRVFGRVVFSRNSKNLGFGGSYNRAASMARGEILVITNDDVYLCRNSVDNLAQVLDNEIALAGPITGWRGVANYQYCKQAPKLESYSKKNFDKIEGFAFRIRKFLATSKLKETKFITGFCFAIKQDVFKSLKGFDERFIYGHIEDTDLVRRVAKNYKTVVAPSVYIHHGGIGGGSASINQSIVRLKKYRIVNSLKYILKWRDPFGFLWLQIHSIYCYYGIGTVSSLVKKFTE